VSAHRPSFFVARILALDSFAASWQTGRVQLLRRWFLTRQKTLQLLEELSGDVTTLKTQVAALRTGEAEREAAVADTVQKLMKIYKRMQTRAAAEGEDPDPARGTGNWLRRTQG